MSDLIISGHNWQALKEQAAYLVKSKFLPTAVDTPEKAIAIAMKGIEIGIPVMQAFSHINIIQGKPSQSAENMLYMIYKNCPGAVVNFISRTDKECSIEAKRPGGKPTTFTFTLDDANAMGLTGKDNWKKQPKVMLQWRCVSQMARAMFADAISGISYTPEELDPDVVVGEEGDVINIPFVKEAELYDSTKNEHKGKLMKAAMAMGLNDKESWADLNQRMNGKPLEDLDLFIEMYLDNNIVKTKELINETSAT